MKLSKLPSVLTENKFNEKGLVEKIDRLLVPAYVGSQFGFNFPGRYFLDNFFYPKLDELGVLPLCPFAACSEYLNISKMTKIKSVKELERFWKRFNSLVGVVNYETLMSHAKFMIALFDGSHAVDDGLSAEVAFFAKTQKSIVGIRSDFRLAENPAALINPAISYFVDQNLYGQFFQGSDAYTLAFQAIKKLADTIKESK